MEGKGVGGKWIKWNEYVSGVSTMWVATMNLQHSKRKDQGFVRMRKSQQRELQWWSYNTNDAPIGVDWVVQLKGGKWENELNLRAKLQQRESQQLSCSSQNGRTEIWKRKGNCWGFLWKEGGPQWGYNRENEGREICRIWEGFGWSSNQGNESGICEVNEGIEMTSNWICKKRSCSNGKWQHQYSSPHILEK